jgi:hypothetical protein
MGLPKLIRTILVSYVALASFAVLGGTMSGGGGGDGVAAEFMSIAHEVLEAVGGTVISKTNINTDKLITSLEGVTVSSTTDDLVVDGVEKDAENWPDRNLIEINRPRWSGLSSKDRQRLVVHEIVSVNGYDDQDYSISDAIIAVASAPSNTFMDMHRGSDSVGNDYSITSATDENVCASICNQDSKCVAMEFNYTNNKCYLKQAVGAVSTSSNGVLSLKTISFRTSIDFFGGDYRFFSTNDVYSCSQQCVQEVQCAAFTFNLVTKLCWLKSSAAQQIATSNAIGGKK